jgi:hypothetical protein
MKGQWIIKEVYFEEGFPKIIRDLAPEKLSTPETRIQYKDIKDLTSRSEFHPQHQRGEVTHMMMIARLCEEIKELRHFIEINDIGPKQ